MGFKQGGYMTVWSVDESKSGNATRVRLSSSRKNRKTEEYEQDFSGFCTFIGPAHEAAGRLKEKDRIKILECDVGTTYDKEKKIEYVNYKVFSFEMADGTTVAAGKTAETHQKAKKTAALVEEGEVDEENLPF